MQDGNACLDLVFVLFDDMDGFLGFLPGFCRVAEYKKGIGDDIQLIAPLDQIVKILDIDLFIDDCVPDTF